MTVKRGISLYSYQQTQFFGILNLWEQLREVREGLGTDGVEIISQQSIPNYPFPSNAFVNTWFEHLEKYDLTPVAYDPHLDVLQFRDHVMDLDEAADRLKRDIRIAHRLGFGIVRTHSSMPMELQLKVLPLAEQLGIRLALEIHAPMSLTGPEVDEIVDYCERTGTRSIGIHPDFGIFQTRINEPTAAWYLRNGCRDEAVAFAQSLCDDHVVDQIDASARDYESHQLFVAYVLDGTEPPAHLAKGIKEYVALCRDALGEPSRIEWDLLGWPLRLPRSTGEELEALAPYVFSCHAKFYEMTEIPGRPGEYEDKAVDNETAIRALKRGGFNGYVNSENEGQRHYHDLDFEHYQDELEQARRHHEMLERLIRTA